MWEEYYHNHSCSINQLPQSICWGGAQRMLPCVLLPTLRPVITLNLYGGNQYLNKCVLYFTKNCDKWDVCGPI